MTEQPIKYSVVLPVLRAELYIESSVDRICKVMDKVGEPYEVILVDDNSNDGTWQVLKRLQERLIGLRVFRLERNIGQTPATQIGAEQAKGELIITLDDDMQHPPEEIPKLIAAYQQHKLSVIFGDPQKRHHPDRKHKVLVAMGKFVFHDVFMRKYRHVNFFTTFRLFEATLLKTNGGQWANLFFIWQLPSDKAMHIKTLHHPRVKGRSNHTFFRLLRHFSPFLLYFTYIGASALQAIFVVLALLYVVWCMWQGIPVMNNGTWAFLALLALLLLTQFGAITLLNTKERVTCGFEK